MKFPILYYGAVFPPFYRQPRGPFRVFRKTLITSQICNGSLANGSFYIPGTFWHLLQVVSQLQTLANCCTLPLGRHFRFLLKTFNRYNSKTTQAINTIFNRKMAPIFLHIVLKFHKDCLRNASAISETSWQL